MMKTYLPVNPNFLTKGDLVRFTYRESEETRSGEVEKQANGLLTIRDDCREGKYRTFRICNVRNIEVETVAVVAI